ncbi:hypothetical protein SK128_008996, partial [Halocaridina rubra]
MWESHETKCCEANVSVPENIECFRCKKNGINAWECNCTAHNTGAKKNSNFLKSTVPQGSVHESNADLQEEEATMFARINSIITQTEEEIRREYSVQLEEYTESLRNEVACHIKRLGEKIKTNSENRNENTFPQSFENVECHSYTNRAARDATQTNSMKTIARDKERRQQQKQQQGKQNKLQTGTGENPGSEDRDA